MQTIHTEDLANISGGQDLGSNVGNGARRLGDRWSQDAYQWAGGDRRPWAGFFGAAGGLFGTIVGAFDGVGHTVDSNIPLPQR